MKPIKKILVPMDFSIHSTQALELAVDLARRCDAELDLIYVYQGVTYALPEGYVLVTPDQLAEILGEFEKRLTKAKQDTEAAGVSHVQMALIEGDPRPEILRRATEGGYDLIVMGTHGRSGAKRLFLGSVAEHVVRSAKCPVLTVRAES